MVKKNTLSILETIKNKLNRLDDKSEIENSVESDNEFDYVPNAKKEEMQESKQSNNDSSAGDNLDDDMNLDDDLDLDLDTPKPEDSIKNSGDDINFEENDLAQQEYTQGVPEGVRDQINNTPSKQDQYSDHEDEHDGLFLDEDSHEDEEDHYDDAGDDLSFDDELEIEGNNNGVKDRSGLNSPDDLDLDLDVDDDELNFEDSLSNNFAAQKSQSPSMTTEKHDDLDLDLDFDDSEEELSNVDSEVLEEENGDLDLDFDDSDLDDHPQVDNNQSKIVGASDNHEDLDFDFDDEGDDLHQNQNEEVGENLENDFAEGNHDHLDDSEEQYESSVKAPINDFMEAKKASDVVNGALDALSPELMNRALELLEPKLEDWIKNNLGPIVENVVREEIRYLSGKNK